MGEGVKTDGGRAVERDEIHERHSKSVQPEGPGAIAIPTRLRCEQTRTLDSGRVKNHKVKKHVVSEHMKSGRSHFGRVSL